MVGNCAFPDLQVGKGRGHVPAALMPTSTLGAQRVWPERKPRSGEGHPQPLPGPSDCVLSPVPTDPQMPGKGMGGAAGGRGRGLSAAESGGREVAAAARLQPRAGRAGVEGGSARL